MIISHVLFIYYNHLFWVKPTCKLRVFGFNKNAKYVRVVWKELSSVIKGGTRRFLACRVGKGWYAPAALLALLKRRLALKHVHVSYCVIFSNHIFNGYEVFIIQFRINKTLFAFFVFQNLKPRFPANPFLPSPPNYRKREGLKSSNH